MRKLVRPGDFKAVYKEGKRYVSPLAIIFVRPSEGETFRLGISAGRRIGKAVLRNKVRRRIREAVRQLPADPLRGADVVIVPRPAAAEAPFDDLVRVLSEAFHRVRGVSGGSLIDSHGPRARG